MSAPTLSVAVITATIGRETLLQTIESVRQQSYPCRHYIFVDGLQYQQAVRQMIQFYPELQVIYLPINTGNTKQKLLNSAINAIAPYLVEEDIICYLDDDNYYAPSHIQTLVEDLSLYQADYAYSLRYLIDEKGVVLGEDNIESLGFWKVEQLQYRLSFPVGQEVKEKSIITNFRQGHLIDVNCFAIRRELALKLHSIWFQTGWGNDKKITDFLLSQQYKGICTGQYSVYYRVILEKMNTWDDDTKDFFQLHHQPKRYKLFLLQQLKSMQQSVLESYQNECGKLAWQYKTLFQDGMLFRLQ